MDRVEQMRREKRKSIAVDSPTRKTFAEFFPEPDETDSLITSSYPPHKNYTVIQTLAKEPLDDYHFRRSKAMGRDECLDENPLWHDTEIPSHQPPPDSPPHVFRLILHHLIHLSLC